MTQEPVTLTREQLYELVWNEPTRTIAVRCGLSDRGLAKICIRLHLPLPGRGYRQKKAAGKDVGAHASVRCRSATPAERQVVVGGEFARKTDASASSASGGARARTGAHPRRPGHAG